MPPRRSRSNKRKRTDSTHSTAITMVLPSANSPSPSPQPSPSQPPPRTIVDIRVKTAPSSSPERPSSPAMDYEEMYRGRSSVSPVSEQSLEPGVSLRPAEDRDDFEVNVPPDLLQVSSEMQMGKPPILTDIICRSFRTRSQMQMQTTAICQICGQATTNQKMKTSRPPHRSTTTPSTQHTYGFFMLGRHRVQRIRYVKVRAAPIVTPWRARKPCTGARNAITAICTVAPALKSPITTTHITESSNGISKNRYSGLVPSANFATPSALGTAVPRATAQAGSQNVPMSSM